MEKNRKWIIGGIAMLILVPVIVFGAFGAYGLSQTDKLPWQTEPTRIPITPVEIPSFGSIGGTPVPTTTS